MQLRRVLRHRRLIPNLLLLTQNPLPLRQSHMAPRAQVLQQAQEEAAQLRRVLRHRRLRPSLLLLTQSPLLLRQSHMAPRAQVLQQAQVSLRPQQVLTVQLRHERIGMTMSPPSMYGWMARSAAGVVGSDLGWCPSGGVGLGKEARVVSRLVWVGLRVAFRL